MDLDINDLLIIEYKNKTYSISVKELVQNTFAMPEDISAIESKIQALLSFIEEQSISFGDTHPTKADFEKTYKRKIEIQNTTNNDNYINQDKLTAAIGKYTKQSDASQEATTAKNEGLGIIARTKKIVVKKFVEWE